MTMTLALFFEATRLRNALNFSGCSPIASNCATTSAISRSHNAVMFAFYDDAGNVIEAHKHKGDFKEP